MQQRGECLPDGTCQCFPGYGRNTGIGIVHFILILFNLLFSFLYFNFFLTNDLGQYCSVCLRGNGYYMNYITACEGVVYLFITIYMYVCKKLINK